MDKTSFEFLFKIDEDDEGTILAVNRVEKFFPWIPVKKIISPRGNGYEDFHLWVNGLAGMATGDWLTIWNDDGRMKTERWDGVLLLTKPKSVWAGMNDVSMWIPKSGHIFFFLRRKVFEILGHVSLDPFCDTWIFSVMNLLRATNYCGIEIEHRKEKSDVITGEYRKWRNPSNEIRRLMLKDAEVLLAHLERVSA